MAEPFNAAPSPEYLAATAAYEAAWQKYDEATEQLARDHSPQAQRAWDDASKQLRTAADALNATPEQQYLDEIKAAERDARIRNLADEIARMPNAMHREHPRWRTFCNLLDLELKIHGCSGDGSQLDPDNPGEIWPQPHPTRWLSLAVLECMDLSADEIDLSFRYFDENGGYCDCEVLMNVDRNP